MTKMNSSCITHYVVTRFFYHLMHSNNKSVILWLTEWMLANIGQFFTFFKTVSYYSNFFFTRWKYKWIRIILSLATLTLAYGVVLLKYTKYRWMKGSISREMFRCAGRREKCKVLVLSNELYAPFYREVSYPSNVRQPTYVG